MGRKRLLYDARKQLWEKIQSDGNRRGIHKALENVQTTHGPVAFNAADLEAQTRLSDRRKGVRIRPLRFT